MSSMSDGAHTGVTAGRALNTILGGAEQPTDDERSTAEETRVRIEAAPLFEGPKPWDVDADDGYVLVADSIAHAFLILIEEDESLLEPQKYPESYPDGEPLPEGLRGACKDQASVVWDALKTRWPNASEWCSGASGFQVGFALNAALYASGKEIGFPNPAIVEVHI